MHSSAATRHAWQGLSASPELGDEAFILTPVYNGFATLTAAVREGLRVDYPRDIELVIVDDGSTDGTRDLYGPFESDPRVSVAPIPAGGERVSRPSGR